MKIRLLAVGTKPPNWVDAAFAEYAKRMPRDMPLELVQIPAAKHLGGKGAKAGSTTRFIRQEGDKMLLQIGKGERLIALDEGGQAVSSQGLSTKLQSWRDMGGDVCLAVGGSDGLAPALLERADECLSLSSLTLPHYLVRVVVAEALYRAWSICIGHPYHRA